MLKVAIVGATGYTGQELIKILDRHAKAELTAVTSTSAAGKRVNEVYPELDFCDLEYEIFSINSFKTKGIKLAFLATPHGTSMQFAPDLLAAGIKVVDLSADYRFHDVAIYEKKYPKHTSPEWCSKAVYGLCEVFTQEIRKANLIGNPGCYVTSVLLPLLPIIDKIEDIIVDSKSGVSGAGVKVESAMNDFRKTGDFKAYSIGGHRHQDEMEYYLGKKIEFTPHLLPVFRGILSSIHFNSKATVEELNKLLQQAYSHKNFVQVLEDQEPQLSMVVNTNNCFMKIYKGTKEGHYVLISVLDNLIKGASGQAVQNMNIMFGFDESMGLI